MNVEDLGNMFYNCSKLETLIFSTNEKPSSVTDFSSMFAFSVKLTSIDISFFSLSNAKDMGYMFKGCKQLQYVRFPENEIAEKRAAYACCWRALIIPFPRFAPRRDDYKQQKSFQNSSKMKNGMIFHSFHLFASHSPSELKIAHGIPWATS